MRQAKKLAVALERKMLLFLLPLGVSVSFSFISSLFVHH